jgi:hypothetical protein
VKQLLLLPLLITLGQAAGAQPPKEWPENLRVVLENTEPLSTPRGDRLPLFVLPIGGALSALPDDQAAKALDDLAKRGIGYSVRWSSGSFETLLKEGLRIGAMQQHIGMPVAIDATGCLHSFFDGTEKTQHVDADGKPFAEKSFGGTMGCPFTLEHRIPVIRKRVEAFLKQYKAAGVAADFVFADWEIDGPIEWNDAWASSKRCRRCREHVPEIDDFRKFQTALRTIRSRLQRVAFGDNVTAHFPDALVGNYGVYPHNGHRYWYDYFERETPDAPALADQKARYREWAHEFGPCGYTFAMPVVYTWYPTFGWYDFEPKDYRWFYNMLLTASNAGRHTPQQTPIIPFVHWHTTAPPANPDPAVEQFSREKYQELLWHMLLRGHDTFFLWCTGRELATEIQLVHEVYRESLQYSGFIDRGVPIEFDVPSKPGPVVSGLRLGNRVLARRTDFGTGMSNETLAVAGGGEVSVAAKRGMQILTVEQKSRHPGILTDHNGRLRFPIGFYEFPGDKEKLQRMAESGINLVRCSNRAALDSAHAQGMMGWVPLSVQQGATPGLRKQIETLRNHPALAVWEGPDEIVWTFTAYSFLKERAGFTREDWNNQIPKAVNYAKKEGDKVITKMNEGIRLVQELDERNLPFWVNEAADSDVKYVRDYIDSIDITGCDYYAVRSTGTDLQSIGRLVDRWDAISRGKPVWMVLQGFSWHKAKAGRKRLYPSYNQSRFMAYDAIVHGARGILYWGTQTIDDPLFRESLYAMTSELSALEPLLVVAVSLKKKAVIDDLFDAPGIGVRGALKGNQADYLLILVNEDDHRHLGVDVSELEVLNGRTLHLLYGDEKVVVRKGGIVTRMQGHEVKVFCTNPRFETKRTEGRHYVDAGK